MEDECQDRDASGLRPGSDTIESEAETFNRFGRKQLVIVPLSCQILAWGAYLVCGRFLGQQGVFDQKFGMIHEFQLGYVYLAVWIFAQARAVIYVSANAARAPARVDRPDQH